MTRINTNVSSLTAQNALANSQSQLQTALTRLSTGLQINSGADNPAGLIEAQNLGTEITADNAAISNSNQANDLISTADSALSQVSTLLNTIRGLVSDSANTGALTSSQIAADQLQVDSSLQAIDQISQTTEFQGSRLLDGSLDFQTTSAGTIGLKATGTFGTLSTNTAASGTVGNATPAAASGSIGVATAAAASGTIGSGTNAITLTGAVGDPSPNSLTVTYTSGSSTEAASASYNSGTNTLTVNIKTSTTTAADVVTAINALGGTPVSASSTQTGLVSAGSVASTVTGGAAVTAIALTGVTGTASTNGLTVAYTSGSSTEAASASYNASANTLTVNIKTSSTTAADVATAINALSGTPVTAATTATGVVSTTSYSDAVTGGAADTAITLTGVAGTTSTNGLTVAYTSGSSTEAASASYNSSANTLTVNIKTGSTTAADVVTAINALSGSPVTAASTATGVVSTTSYSDAVTGAAAGNQFTVSASNIGSQYNGVTVSITSGASGSATASYNTASNAITVVATSTSTASDIATAISGITGGLFSATALGSGTADTGTLSATTSGGSIDSSISGLQINQANFGTASTLPVNVTITKQATQAELIYSGGALSSNATLQIGGSSGYQVFKFGSGATTAQIASAINNASDATGVDASVVSGNLVLKSQDYGSSNFVSAKALSGTFNTVDSGDNAVTRATGTDIQASINGIQATGNGLQVSLDTTNLNLSFDVDSSYTDNSTLSFSITGGGATFQLGPDVSSNQQVTLGIQGVSTATLGGTDGTLYELASGGAADLSTDPTTAAKIVNEVIDQVTSLQGRLGAFQSTTLQTNITSLTDAVSNLTSAQSDIQDANYATETAALTRAQILVQAGTSVLSIANQTPQNVLTLLKSAGG